MRHAADGNKMLVFEGFLYLCHVLLLRAVVWPLQFLLHAVDDLQFVCQHWHSLVNPCIEKVPHHLGIVVDSDVVVTEWDRLLRVLKLCVQEHKVRKLTLYDVKGVLKSLEKELARDLKSEVEIQCVQAKNSRHDIARMIVQGRDYRTELDKKFDLKHQPDCIIVISQANCLSGFPSWYLRNAEI